MRASRWFAVVGLGLGPLVFATCSHDSTGPEIPANVDVEVAVTTVSGPVYVTRATPNGAPGDSEPAVQCGAQLHAAVSGTGTAKWLDAVLRLYAGKDRSQPVDSITFPAAQMQAAWGGAEITSGQGQNTLLSLTVSVPFAVTIAFHYEPASGGSVQTALVSFACGPIPPANAPPPTITAFSAQAPAGGLQPGNALAVSYAATGPAGLWETVIQLTGACSVRRVVAEKLQVSVADTVKIPLPLTCQLGVPLSVTLQERDAALQQTSQVLGTQFSISDRTPPFVYPLLERFYQDGAGSTVFARDYFVGDTIYVELNASDNYALKTLYWEVWPAGFRDSLVTSGQQVATFLRLPIPPAWLGSIQMKFYARDAVGLTSDTVVTAPDSLRVGATIQRPVVTATLPAQLLDMQIDAKRGVVYVVPAWGNNLFAVSTTTGAFTSIPLAQRPWGIDLSPGGDSLIVTFPGLPALGIMDLRQAAPAVVSLIPLAPLDTTSGQRLTDVKVAANGKAFLPLEGNNASAFTLVEVDLASGAERIRSDAGQNGLLGGAALERSYDHATLVTNGNGTEFQRYDVASDAFGPLLTARSTWGPSVDGTGQHIVVGLDLYDANLQYVRSIRSLFGVPTRAVSPDGSYLFEAWRGVIRARLSDGALQDRSPAPFTPTLARVSSDGTTLAMFDFVSGQIAVMDLR